MPNFDRTGPEGKGPKTGRGTGYCGDKSEVPEEGTTQTGQTGPRTGRGLGFRRGFGRQRR
ncbi:DUF5320 domain-containing protein [Candidatus Woesearchaeota archaeon]|nr:DUF5320 domain-containing protein [Candidatus Woesearchaeota archaeon]